MRGVEVRHFQFSQAGYRIMLSMQPLPAWVAVWRTKTRKSTSSPGRNYHPWTHLPPGRQPQVMGGDHFGILGPMQYGQRREIRRLLQGGVTAVWKQREWVRGDSPMEFGRGDVNRKRGSASCSLARVVTGAGEGGSTLITTGGEFAGGEDGYSLRNCSARET